MVGQRLCSNVPEKECILFLYFFFYVPSVQRVLKFGQKATRRSYQVLKNPPFLYAQNCQYGAHQTRKRICAFCGLEPLYFYKDFKTYLNEHLPQRSIGRTGHDDKALLKWPLRSPDMTPFDFFLLGKVFVPPFPRDLVGLRGRFRNEFAAVPRDMCVLVRVWTEMEYRCKDLLPVPGNRSNETHDIERRIWKRQRRESRNGREKGKRWRKKRGRKKKIRLDDVL
ncbi:uncharacterized protein TNCV_2532721 [Trichonephila clavipes]|nr:uncharacterized protein TNCV_2532721 [Trichonephila clavipes]